MTCRPAAEVGMPLAEVDTPCLILELDAFERNLEHLPTGTMKLPSDAGFGARHAGYTDASRLAWDEGGG